MSSDHWKKEVISSQQFDGCWDEQAIRKILSSKADSALTANPQTSLNHKLWSTALAIAILELICQDSKSSWEMVANKGRTFMSKTLFAEKKDKDEIANLLTSLISKAQEVLQKL
jgi:hypothetical protein